MFIDDHDIETTDYGVPILDDDLALALPNRILKKEKDIRTQINDKESTSAWLSKLVICTLVLSGQKNAQIHVPEGINTLFQHCLSKASEDRSHLKTAQTLEAVAMAYLCFWICHNPSPSGYGDDKEFNKPKEKWEKNRDQWIKVAMERGEGDLKECKAVNQMWFDKIGGIQEHKGQVKGDDMKLEELEKVLREFEVIVGSAFVMDTLKE